MSDDIPREEFAELCDDLVDDRKRIALRMCVCAHEMRGLEGRETSDIADGAAGLADQLWPDDDGVPDEITVDVE